MSRHHISKKIFINLLTLTSFICFATLAQAAGITNLGVPVPEPGMMLLFGSGLAGVAAFYRKFKR